MGSVGDYYEGPQHEAYKNSDVAGDASDSVFMDDTGEPPQAEESGQTSDLTLKETITNLVEDHDNSVSQNSELDKASDISNNLRNKIATSQKWGLMDKFWALFVPKKHKAKKKEGILEVRKEVAEARHEYAAENFYDLSGKQSSLRSKYETSLKDTIDNISPADRKTSGNLIKAMTRILNSESGENIDSVNNAWRTLEAYSNK